MVARKNFKMLQLMDIAQCYLAFLKKIDEHSYRNWQAQKKARPKLNQEELARQATNYLKN